MKNIRITRKNKSLWMLLIALFFLFSCSSDHLDDGTRFENKTLRMDYLHSGDKNSSSIEFLAWKEEPFWGGPKRNLIDDPLKGEFVVEIFDISKDELIYSKGFSTSKI